MSETPLNLLGMFFLGLYDTDDPATNLVGYWINAKGRTVKPHHSGRQMSYAASRGAFVLGRDISALEEPMSNAKPSRATARKWMDKCFLPWVRQFGDEMHKVYFHGRVNEPGNLEKPAPGEFDYLLAYSEEEAARAEFMAAEGYLACLGNFSAEARIGIDKTSRVLEMTRAAVKYGGLIGLDAYGSPNMLNANVHEFVFPEEPLAASLQRLGEPVPAFANPELGIDAILSLSLAYHGWRTTGITGADYLYQLVEVCKRKKALGLVKTVQVFVDDSYPGTEWSQYNTHGGRPARPKQNDPGELPVTIMICNYHSTYPDVPVVRPVPGTVPVPVPDPDPIPDPVQPVGLIVNVDDGVALNVRSGPGAGYNILFQSVRGERLIGIKHVDGWWQLKPRARFPDVYVSDQFVAQEI